jgi:hypothetical protein
MVSSAVPIVHVTIEGTTTHYYDPGQILNTHGVDAAGCPYTGTRNDESSDWQAIHAEISLSVLLPAISHAWLASPHPNPSRGKLAIHFGTTVRGPVRLGIYDVAGRLVKTSINDVLDPGNYHDVVNLGGVGAGLYYCRLTTPEARMSRTFVVVR